MELPFVRCVFLVMRFLIMGETKKIHTPPPAPRGQIENMQAFGLDQPQISTRKHLVMTLNFPWIDISCSYLARIFRDIYVSRCFIKIYSCLVVFEIYGRSILGVFILHSSCFIQFWDLDSCMFYVVRLLTLRAWLNGLITVIVEDKMSCSWQRFFISQILTVLIILLVVMQRMRASFWSLYDNICWDNKLKTSSSSYEITFLTFSSSCCSSATR